MTNQKAVHIISYEREWKEIWSSKNGPAEVTCGKINFMCGKEWSWVRFPEDKSDIEGKPKHLPTCKKCLKKKSEIL
jgi:hypothetical protein